LSSQVLAVFMETKLTLTFLLLNHSLRSATSLTTLHSQHLPNF
jgi:hypothetical protein